MKKVTLILSLFVMVIMIGCSSNNEEPKYKVTKTGTETSYSSGDSPDLSIVGETTIQGCEYFVVHTYWNNIPVHKGNCKNPIHYKMCDSTKFIDRLEKDSMKIKFLEMKLEVLEKVNNSLLKSSKHENH